MQLVNLRVELRAGEGGQDAHLLVKDMLAMYVNFCVLEGL